ncbi:MAG: C25 family cysteine peptidase [Pirellulales bacterium]|nr:C25 family cysteine peptidase [Pirellulales bacterium]
MLIFHKHLAAICAWTGFAMATFGRLHAQDVPAPGEGPRSAEKSPEIGIAPGAAASNTTHLVAVVCPPEWRTALDKWAAYRAAQGYQLIWVEPAATAAQTRAELILRHQASPLTAVLLIGDVPVPQADVPRPNFFDAIPRREGARGTAAPRRTYATTLAPATPRYVESAPVRPGTPTHYVRAQVIPGWGGEELIASDLPYADLDGDDVPDVACGRWPVDNGTELALLARRTIDYEQSRDYGWWRGRVNLVAGVGGFGAVTDNVIESGARQILLTGLPRGYSTTLTQASWSSPYCPSPRQFTRAACDRFNEGCLFWIYVGHGQPRGLDYLYTPDRGAYPILRFEDCREMRARGTPPIAIFLACSTGAFDKAQDALAEEILRQPAGPVAVIANTRVAMPYGMSVFGLEGLHAGLRETDGGTGDIRLGQVVQQAKLRSLRPPERAERLPVRRALDATAAVLTPEGHDASAELLEHAHLITLFGDPLLQLPRPGTISLAGPARAARGSTITVAATLPCAGKCRWDVCLPPGQTARSLTHRTKYDSSPAALAEYQPIYEECLEARLWHSESEQPAGRQEISIPLPAQYTGELLVRVWIEGAKECALGCLELKVEK